MKLYTVMTGAPDGTPTNIFTVDLGDVKLLNLLGHLREAAVRLNNTGILPGVLNHCGALAEVSFYIEGRGFSAQEVRPSEVCEEAWWGWAADPAPMGTPVRMGALRICAHESAVWWTHYTDDYFNARRETRPLPWTTIFPETA